MAENQLEVERDLAIDSCGFESANHGGIALLAGERFGPLIQCVTSSNSRKVGKQAGAVFVADRQAVDVQHRIPQPGIHKSVAKVVHIQEAIHMCITRRG